MSAAVAQTPMESAAAATEAVVRNHLRSFLERRGVEAIVADYHDDARFHAQDRTYRGTAEIHRFFEGFLAALPPRGVERFALRTLRVDGELAYITWDIGADIPLGTDTFLVRGGRIVAQTCALLVAQPRKES
jgi:ketosteroid isomerase-like protein